MKLNQFTALAFSLTVAAAHGVAQAGPITFNESTCGYASATATSVTCATRVSGVNHTATATAWSAPTNGKFATASIDYFAGYGLGIDAAGEPGDGSQHSADNVNGTDAFLINFGAANFALNQISIGWLNGDADVSILRYTGAGAPASLASNTVATLDAAADWDWVGNYSTLRTNPVLNFNTGANAKTGAWWLVSAYNSAYTAGPIPNDFGNNNDYFKLNGFGGELVAVTPPVPPNKVPEPGSFALFGIALAGFVAARRKWQAR